MIDRIAHDLAREDVDRARRHFDDQRQSAGMAGNANERATSAYRNARDCYMVANDKMMRAKLDTDIAEQVLSCALDRHAAAITAHSAALDTLPVAKERLDYLTGLLAAMEGQP